MGKEIDPSDVGKFPDLIKKAQAEMTKMDVLVCGQCNGIYHFIEQFKQHKGNGCNKVSPIKDNLETKPVIWAFLLWKASYLNQEPTNKDNSNAWKLYQSWVKLEDAIRETWIVAGRTIQSFAKIGQGQLQEMPVKITKTVIDNSHLANSATKKPIQVQRGIVRPGPKELDTAFNALKQEPKKPIIRSPQQNPVRLPQVARPIPAKQGSGPISRMALRTLGAASNGAGTEVEESTIEKILAKRFNPRHKEHEYLIKWMNSTHESNTWEPVSHLETCPELLDTFEKQLARQKEQRLAAAAKQAPQSEPIKIEDDAGAAKKRKIETPEPSKIIPVASTAANKGKPNGIPFANSVKTETSAEVVITNSNDGKPTGIVKKAGISSNPVAKNEAQVRLIPKGGDSVSGVVRVTPKKPVQQLGNTTVKPVQNVARQSGIIPKTAAQRSIPGRSPSVQQLNAASPQNASYQTAGPSPAAKPTITRVMKNAPNAKQSTPEQKIAALTRQGDLKITRKSAVQPQPQATVIVADDEDFSVREDFELSIPASVATSIPNNSEAEMALCPVQEEQQTDEGAVLMSDQDGLQQILSDDGQQLIQFVTGEDGTIYQVAGKNEQGQTVLIAQGADGEQQCVYVAAEEGEGMGAEDVGNGMMSVDGSMVEGTEHQQQQQQILVNEAGEQVQFAEGDAGTIPLSVTTDDADSQDGQITAEVVQADLPSPGGTRRVVLQLPDGTFMVTEVDEEQFKALNMQG